eukprot:CAMPEP_0198115884 /NCGR_PEP_ID=MMETSP1442-20131203/7926_1 /TAXON_ID= /ORGANISM="Craspedostauros australis, Strain CCMP3328" /LENGTH=99 /DNA_ID=CAMNT_0043773481 /DNA_START=57 /DNA_END=356 /DNA_ORIENTATION=+
MDSSDAQPFESQSPIWVVSDDSNSPPDFCSTPSTKILYDPEPSLQQIPSPYVSKIVIFKQADLETHISLVWTSMVMSANGPSWRRTVSPSLSTQVVSDP